MMSQGETTNSCINLVWCLFHYQSFQVTMTLLAYTVYSHLSNERGGWNKHGGGAKFAKSLNVEVGINVEGGIL